MSYQKLYLIYRARGDRQQQKNNRNTCGDSTVTPIPKILWNEKHDFWIKIFNLSVEKRQATVGIWVSGLEDQVEEISQSRAKIQMVTIAKEMSNLEQRPRRTEKWIIGIPEIEKGREWGKALTRQTLAEAFLSLQLEKQYWWEKT